MRRESGFYWIQYLSSTWQVAEWNATRGIWWVCGSELPKYERDIDYINEQRILSPDDHIKG